MIGLAGAAALLLAAAQSPSGDKEPGRVVYWGNSNTGKAVSVLNYVNAEQMAQAEKDKIGGAGWVLYENSTVPGYGAAICTKENGQVQFYTAHGFKTRKEAVRAARQKALAAGGITFLCARPLWFVAEEAKPPLAEPGVMDRVRGVVRNIVVGSPEAIAKHCTPPKEPPSRRAELKPIGTGSMPLKDERPAATAPWKAPDWCPSRPSLITVGRRG